MANTPPKRAVLGLADLKSEYLAAPVGGHPVRSDAGHGKG